ncbi:MAG: agmatine deiminase family protein, partial [Candidatus Eremiobacteraeota bacterium]|nr:agmatine deiminase family protein [Candidatus Eremiobacteraeota bacterium]
MKTSAEYRMPAEWERHACTLMAWPTDVSIWAGALEQARDEYAATARAVARFESVIMIVRPGDERD